MAVFFCVRKKSGSAQRRSREIRPGTVPEQTSAAGGVIFDKAFGFGYIDFWPGSYPESKDSNVLRRRIMIRAALPETES